MGACCSTSSRSSCSSRSNGETIAPACLGIGLHGRKRTKKTFSDHVNMLQHLPTIPNRIFTNGKSRTSCIFTQQGRKGINQDAMIVWEDFMSEDVTFCGVFDGHGPHGHLVARKVRDALPLKLLSFLHSCESKQNGSGTTCFKKNLKSDGGNVENVGSNEDRLDSLWREAFLKSYKAMDKELRSHPNLDCFCSGSTAVTIVKQGSNLFMGNIGDSRAILGSKDSSDSMMATQLTVDLKPDLPREAERIKRCKGRVFALQDEPEVPRVWLPFDDAPGLAMARAFGDFCLKEYGVISIPEFSHRTLTDRDQFIVLASDGVFGGCIEANEEKGFEDSNPQAKFQGLQSAAKDFPLRKKIWAAFRKGNLKLPQTSKKIGRLCKVGGSCLVFGWEKNNGGGGTREFRLLEGGPLLLISEKKKTPPRGQKIHSCLPAMEFQDDWFSRKKNSETIFSAGEANFSTWRDHSEEKLKTT
ncbi:probable protein phosphatase 2C 52 [Malania oleifera]|uniref:probable protein phosphatase 2C 52 n=1 Tax=Malania oleifera TaxID=397392 RepID=UPI0025AE3AC7|nr:probable protein phosphatase 2C 52 [Malania oleifera]XP_057956208.1 probable protein phosphatase 2C 52 [Malania oleifera]XP_057956209.1 probable protein phosphatase 2C 52 [Malania oleifera]XP_057956210.1 probable protein phosphatase 2C 52 [Malania oleifera]XP_057956211.1 probable protein phosphatase 2C 52 [Malania oleifera]XP_057956212.1 probable protein phosphatase 2C 52 [Malania oleifera]